MRLSVIPTDPGYREDAGFYHVFFKGIILRNVITADEEKGEVLCYVQDNNGNAIKHPDKPGTFLTETKRGEVHIQQKETARVRNKIRS